MPRESYEIFEWRRVETCNCFYHAARLRSHKAVRICIAKCSAFSGLVLEALIVHKLKMHKNLHTQASVCVLNVESRHRNERTAEGTFAYIQ